MIHNRIEVSAEFGSQVKIYLDHFGLTEGDLSRLINSNTNKVRDIITGEKGVVISSAERIANVFGLRYFELGNPAFPIPPTKTLPKQTLDAIQNRKKIGVPIIIRNYENDIAGNLDRIIHETSLLHNAVTAEEIRLHFPNGIRDEIKPVRITDLLKKSGRDQYVVMVGKRGKEYLFQLKEYVDSSTKR